ncbi:uncharacterized protein LOC120639508 isoform X2 [Panicum virgatum]|nr:uncharacterized protein LOC120639508 isoform X2 [Panicum virgatum]
MLVPKENTGILVPSDQICVETPTSVLVERNSGDEILQGTPRSRMTKTPLSYVHHSPLTRSKSMALSVATSQCVKMKRSKLHRSPLTRSKSKSLSIATPESVKIKQSRSGRLIVARLDPGSQNITYGPDGCICGITNLEASFPQGISSEPPSKRRMSQRLSPDLYRLLTF